MNTRYESGSKFLDSHVIDVLPGAGSIDVLTDGLVGVYSTMYDGLHSRSINHAMGKDSSPDGGERQAVSRCASHTRDLLSETNALTTSTMLFTIWMRIKALDTAWQVGLSMFLFLTTGIS